MPKITKTAQNDAEILLADVRADRILREQELGWLFRPLAVCPFPAYSLGKRLVKDAFGREKEEYHVLWTRRAGNVKVEVLGHPDYGIPHGQDTLIILFLAYEARRQGSRKIKVDFYKDFMHMFGMNPRDGRKYRLVIQSLRRICSSKYSWEVIGETRKTGIHFLYIDEYDLYFNPKNPDQRNLPTFEQYILLSERFWHEIQTHKIPSNMKAIQSLKSKPAHLNFYMWLSYRVGQAYRETSESITIPFWGPRGLQEQMSSIIEEKRNFRIEVKKWMKSLKEVWPLCPVEIVEDSLKICVTSADQLDVQPKDTDAPRIGNKKKAELPPAPTSPCPTCGKERTLEAGKIDQKRKFRYPDWWKCPGGCQPTPADAICKKCGSVMTIKNKGKQDYTYHCKCDHIEAGESYWLTHI